MFSLVFVCQSVKLWGRGSHVNFAHYVLGHSIVVYKSIMDRSHGTPPPPEVNMKWTPPPHPPEVDAEEVVEEDQLRSTAGQAAVCL